MTPPSEEMKSMMVNAVGERNDIDCSFDTGKIVYRAMIYGPRFRIHHDAGRECATSSRTWWSPWLYFILSLPNYGGLSFFVVTMSDYVCHPLPVTKYYYSRPCFNKRWLIPTSSRWAIFSTITICSCIGTKKLIVSRQPIFINLNNLIPWKTLCKVINYSLNFQINNVIILCLYLIININYTIRLLFVFVINKYLIL